MGKKGFTLMELVLVSIIIAILISIAVPTYISTLERTRGKEAFATLQSMYAAERTYSAERRIYLGPLNAGSTNWTAVGMDDPNSNNRRAFDYNLQTGGGGTTYNATARRRSGPYSGSYITINQTGTVSTANWPFPQ